jgi:sugar phosphate isomerase/epimerase
MNLSRRDALGLCAGTLSTALLSGPAGLLAGDQKTKTRLGIAIYAFGVRQQAGKQRDPKADLFEPLAFLKHCQRLGAGGIQSPLGVRDEQYAGTLRRQAERGGMFIEGIIETPTDANRLERFEAEVRTAARVGARALRTAILPGRRYEYFDSVEKYREFAERGRRSLELAEPVLARHRVPLAVENHKDSRLPERLELLKRISSEWIGACVDVGNSIALLEDPMAVVEAYAPWALSVHLKDHAVSEYPEGFLLADVPLGQGFLDLKKMVALLRQAKPELHFTLEVITRNPLKVPCLTEKYWITFADVPGRDLARTLRMVRDRRAPALPEVAALSVEDQIAREAANVNDSLVFAREHLAL